MNEEELEMMLDQWKRHLSFLEENPIMILNKEQAEQVVIMLRSYLMTFDKGGYPFD